MILMPIISNVFLSFKTYKNFLLCLQIVIIKRSSHNIILCLFFFQVRLKCKTIHGHDILVERGMVLTQKLKSTQFKTMDGVITKIK